MAYASACFALAAILVLLFPGWRDRYGLLWLAAFCAVVGSVRLVNYVNTSPDSQPWTGIIGPSLYYPPLVEFLAVTFGRRLLLARGLLWSLAVFSLTVWSARWGSTGVVWAPLVTLAALLAIVVRRPQWNPGRVLIAGGCAVLTVFGARSLNMSFYSFLDPLPLTISEGIGFSNFHFLALAFAFGSVVVLVRELISDSQEKQRLSGEIEAARTVQQMLIPSTPAPGVEAVYLPAAEVGGDFWHQADGGRLIVAGDVSGKGLKAAMVVSLITGLLDRRRSDAPGALLAELNEALFARLEGGFVTCCAVRLSDDGRVIIANAGHPAPYADGREVESAGGLPLGLVPAAEYEETVIAFQEQLTLVSDGVVEAANARGELFGFERTVSISTRSAKEIAEAAKQWGQNDDITVVTVRRTA